MSSENIPVALTKPALEENQPISFSSVVESIPGYNPNHERYPSRTIEYLDPTEAELAEADAILAKVGSEAPIQRLLAKMIENGDYTTLEHSERVGLSSIVTAKRLGRSDEDCELLGLAGIAHDLLKQEEDIQPLVHDDRRFPAGSPEREKMKEHVSLAALQEWIDQQPEWDDEKKAKILKLSASHHWHGKDPYGVEPDESVALQAPILMVNDHRDACASQRSYKDPMTKAECFRATIEEFSQGDQPPNPYVAEVIFACFNLPQTDSRETRLSA